MSERLLDCTLFVEWSAQGWDVRDDSESLMKARALLGQTKNGSMTLYTLILGPLAASLVVTDETKKGTS